MRACARRSTSPIAPRSARSKDDQSRRVRGASISKPSPTRGLSHAPGGAAIAWTGGEVASTGRESTWSATAMSWGVLVAVVLFAGCVRRIPVERAELPRLARYRQTGELLLIRDNRIIEVR